MHAPEERWSNSGASRVVPLAPLDYAAELIGEKVGASELALARKRANHPDSTAQMSRTCLPS